jgi:GTP-binding protein Era
VEQVMDMLEIGATAVTDRRPTLLVLNKKDLIKPGEIAKKKEVFASPFGHTRMC